MIKSWKHKGLKRFYETGSVKGIQAQHKKRLTLILQLLDTSVTEDDMNLPGMRYHALKGNMKGHYSVSVNGNWRVIFQFENGNAILVDYLDYH